ncbi:DUF481 domain-containing protein [Planctomycetota bacterium]
MQLRVHKYCKPIALLTLLSIVGLTFAADEVVLKNSDVLQGKIRRQTSYEVVIDHNNLGRLYIPMAEVGEVRWSVDPNTPAGFFKRARQNGWSFTFDLSLDSSTGNTDEQSIRTALGLGRERKRTSFKLNSTYYFKQKNSKTTDNKNATAYEHRFFKENSKVYYFGTGLYDYDDFKSWQQRLSGYGGGGFSWVKTKKVNFETGAGLGARKEWGSINDQVKFEGIGSIGFTWNISERQTVESRFFYAPVLTDFEDYRTRGSLDWRYVLSQEIHVSLLIGLLHEYQSVVNPQDKKEDVRVYMGLQLKL